MNHRIPCTINGRVSTLSYDLAAAHCLEKKYGISFQELAKLRVATKGNDLEFLMKLAFALTRSMDEPPTEKDIERASMEEVFGLTRAVNAAFAAATESVLGKGNGATPAAGGASGGTGAAPSSSSSRSPGGRRKSSGS